MAIITLTFPVLVQFLSFCLITIATQLDEITNYQSLGDRRLVHVDHAVYANDQPLGTKKTHCQYPCKCPKANDALGCKSGVNIIEDGCNCCKMCARQQGDLCDYKDKCDEAKDLYCDFNLDDGNRGVCRVRAAKHCEVDSKSFKDGESFKPNCSLTCTCQNGQYACASLCPQEDRVPSRANCRDAQMVSIRGRCCREWVCPHPHSQPMEEDETAAEPTTAQREACKKETTAWSQCSSTCGIGYSIRVRNDNKNCTSTHERRLCLIRPCGVSDRHMPKGICKTTWREEKAKKLTYTADKTDCTSIEPLQLKYCSTCKKNKCCSPARSKTMEVRFDCSDGKTVNEKMMSIQKCECKALKKCDT